MPVREGWTIDREERFGEGLTPPWMDRSGMRYVDTGIRPVDPRVSGMLEDLSNRTVEEDLREPSYFSLAVRSIDGFYCTKKGALPTQLSDQDLVDVVDFDPVRGWMLTGGGERPDDSSAFLWFAHKAFFHDNMFLLVSLENRTLPDPISYRGAASAGSMLDTVSEWKGSNHLIKWGFLLWRGSDPLLMEKGLITYLRP